MSPLSTQEEAIVAAFERKWRANIVPPWPVGLSSRVLCELAAIDLEYRRRRHAAGAAPTDELGGQPRVEDYQRIVAPVEFSEDELLELMTEEYRAEELWGRKMTPVFFFQRFPSLFSRFSIRVKQVWREHEAEANSSAVPLPHERDPRAPLPYTDFLIHEHLGSGGMGRVYRATQRSLARQVAIKTLRKRLSTNQIAVQRFLQEGRILTDLKHPYIVGMHGAGRFPGGGYFLVLDYIDGADLQSLRAAGPLPPAECVRILRDVVSAVAFAHTAAVIHGDLKPANVLRRNDGQIVVVDFGLARLVAAANAPGAGGTPAYLPPEFDAIEALEPTIAGDVFGLGGLLFHLLTNRPPRDPLDRVLPPSIEDFSPSTPAKLIRLCQTALAPRPIDRHVSVSQFLAELDGAATELTHHKLPPNDAAPPPDPSTSE